jgi:hypothetical protein
MNRYLVWKSVDNLPAVACFFACALTAAVATAGPVTLQVLSGGTTMPRPALPGSGDPHDFDIPRGFLGGDEDGDEGGVEINGVFNPRPFVNRRIGTGPGQPVPAVAAGRAKSNPELMLSFDGLGINRWYPGKHRKPRFLTCFDDRRCPCKMEASL